MFIKAFFIEVGMTGFEPATLWSQTRCATGLRYIPIYFELVDSNWSGESEIRTRGTVSRTSV